MSRDPALRPLVFVDLAPAPARRIHQIVCAWPDAPLEDLQHRPHDGGRIHGIRRPIETRNQRPPRSHLDPDFVRYLLKSAADVSQPQYVDPLREAASRAAQAALGCELGASIWIAPANH